MFELEGIQFERLPGIRYCYDYEGIFRRFRERRISEESAVRELVLNDLFFIIVFILEVPNANREFVVNACREVQESGDVDSLDLWARYHWKTTIRKARNIQRALKYPEKCQCLVSHTRPAAKKHLRPIMQVFEHNRMLKKSFPDRLYMNPRTESPKWSEDDGIVLKGHKDSRQEANIEAWGIKDGMPIGVHFEFFDIDDLETKDDVKNPDVILNVREAVDLCNFLLTEDGVQSFWGTPYSHMGVYIPHIRDKKKANGKPKFLYRRKPATIDGTRTGSPVMLKQEKLDDLFAELEKEGGAYAVNCQMLINPQPLDRQELDAKLLKDIDPEFIPKNVYKFMMIDPAGNNEKNKGDSWAIHLFGVEPEIDEIGASNIYLMESIISPLTDSEAIDIITRTYINAGIVMQLGVEKVGLSSVEVHVANALKAKGRHLSVESGNLFICRPAGRGKYDRIIKALAWPLLNGKLHISKKLAVVKERLSWEMQKLGYWHDDGLDAWAYLYDMISAYSFPRMADFCRPLKFPRVGA